MSHGIYHHKMVIYKQKGSFIVGCACLGVLTAIIVFSFWLLIK